MDARAPRRSSSFFTASAFYLLAAGGLSVGACDCNSEKGSGDGPCASENPPAACGQACSGASSCPSGTYCGSDGTCTADCVAGDETCGAGSVCEPGDGRCVPATDAGAGGGGGGGVGAGGGGGSACEELAVTADPVEPYIIFLVDRSGSMRSTYSNDEGLYPYAAGVDCYSDPAPSPACLGRWDSVRAVLLGADSGPAQLQGEGVIAPFAPFAHIGLVQYTGAWGDGPSGAWPELIETPAALNNLDAIEEAYEAEGEGNPPTVGRTPTGESLWMTLCHLDAPYSSESSPGCDSFDDVTAATTYPADPPMPLLPADRDPGAPVIFILATDGAPGSSLSSTTSFCNSNSRTARRWVLDAASEALGETILTYVISVNDEPEMNLHLEQVACAGGTGPSVAIASQPCGNGSTEPTCDGAGNADGPGLIEAYDTAALNAAITDILASSIPCSFSLTTPIDPSTVAEARASATVVIDGDAVTQATSASSGDGWWLSDDGTTFSLVGQACADFKAQPGAQLEATFPCDSGVIIIPL